MIRISRSSVVPDYILSNISDKQEQKKVQASVAQEVDFHESWKSGVMKYAKAREKVGFIDHGHGVLEASHDATIWWLEGDTIYRKDDENTQAVLKAIEAGMPIDQDVCAHDSVGSCGGSCPDQCPCVKCAKAKS